MTANKTKGKSGGVTLNFEIDGADALLKRLRDLPKDASAEVRDAAMQLATGLAGDVRSAGQRKGGQAALVAATVRPRRDRVPFILVGGSKKVGHTFAGAGKRGGTGRRASASDLLFGSEFGANPSSGKYAPYGFNPHTGRKGSWIFPTVERNQPEIAKAWERVVEAIAANWEKGD